MWNLQPYQLATWMIPTLLLGYALSGSSLAELRPYREVFGGGEYQLDLSFDVNPDGWLLKQSAERRISFHGTLASHDGDEVVRGERIHRDGKTLYVFQFHSGRFEGALHPSPKGCEPKLSYVVEEPGQSRRQGELVAGFCPNL